MKSLKIFVILLLISFILFIIFQLEIFRTKEGLESSYEVPPLCEGDVSSQPPPCWATVQKEKYTGGSVSEFVSDDFILKTKIVTPICPNDPFDDISGSSFDLSGNYPTPTPSRTSRARPTEDVSGNRPTNTSVSPSITTPPITTPPITTPPITTPPITTPPTTSSRTTSSRDISGNNAARDISGNNARDISGNITNNTYLNTTNNSYYNTETNSYESSNGNDSRILKSNNRGEDSRESDFQYIQSTNSPFPSNELDTPYEESSLITSTTPTPTMFYRENEIITPQKPVIPSPAELKQKSNQSMIPLGNPPWNNMNSINNDEPVPLLDDFPTQF